MLALSATAAEIASVVTGLFALVGLVGYIVRHATKHTEIDLRLKAIETTSRELRSENRSDHSDIKGTLRVLRRIAAENRGSMISLFQHLRLIGPRLPGDASLPTAELGEDDEERDDSPGIVEGS